MNRSQTLIQRMLSDGLSIRGHHSFSPSQDNAPAVIFAHGFGSNRIGEKSGALEAECARRGWHYASADFRGHGASDGTMLELRCSRLIEDLESIVSSVEERTNGKIFLYGSSLGGWTSSWVAARHPARIAGLALVAPAFRFLEFRRLRPEERAYWQREGKMRWRNEFIDVEVEYGLTAEAGEYPMEALASRFETPAIVFHGMEDDLVPYTDSIEFTAQCRTREVELFLLKNGDHRLNQESERMARLACDFFQLKF